VRGLDLRQLLSAAAVAEIRNAWLQHQVLAFPGQELSLDDLERIALHFGPFGRDPFFGSVPGHPHIAQVRRDADEKTKIFAETWHSDWSFLPSPPQATLLYGNVIPPVGGDTLFANQYAAWDALSPAMQALLQDKHGVHSARRGYARDGMYGERDQGRSMAIRYGDDAAAPRCSSAPATRSASTACPMAKRSGCCWSCSATRCARPSSTATVGCPACW
jgi:taurine dioxygenase